MKVGSLEIEILAGMARLTTDMNAAKKLVGGAMESIEASVGKAVRALGGLGAGLSLAAFAGKLVSTQREFDILNSSLITVTGSAANADKAFAWIKAFAAETPFSLGEVTGAFIKMKALGLDASEAALTAYGNTASAMGKSLNQMIEAVADAATGEFERLKEFGIKAKKEGDNVALTFRGVTTNIQNDAAEITKYLQALGENEFAGAMALRAATLDGAISNLADTWSELFRTINEESAGGLIMDGVKLATGAINDLIVIIKALNDSTDANTEKTGAMKVMQDAIATVFETVAVLGVNLKYILVQIGNELGGLAAQAVALAKLDVEGAKAIGVAMKRDADAARVQVDATSARILNARKQAEELAKIPRQKGEKEPGMPGPPKPKKATGAADKQLADEQKLMAEMAGLTGSFYKDWDNLTKLFVKGKYDVEQLTAAQAALLAKQPAVREQQKLNADALKEEERAQKAVADAYDKLWAESSRNVAQIGAETEQLRRQRDEFLMSGDALRELDAQRIEQQATVKDGLADLFKSIDLSGSMTAKYKEEADALRTLAAERRNARTPMEEAVLSRAEGGRGAFTESVGAIGKLRDQGQLSSEQLDELAVEKLRSLGVDTDRLQLGLDVQMQQLRTFDEQVREMTRARIIDQTTADMAIAQNKVKMNELQLAGTTEMFGALATLSSSSNKKLSAIGKAAAIADATIQGILAVQRALASAPPPWNYITAAAVGVSAAANVAKISGMKGFMSGGMGYTGDGPLSQPAGVFHGGEFVVNAQGTRENRPLLESINNGGTGPGGAPIQVNFDINNNIQMEGGGSGDANQDQMTMVLNAASKKTQADILNDIRMGGPWATILAR